MELAKEPEHRRPESKWFEGKIRQLTREKIEGSETEKKWIRGRDE